ncbi:MAG: methylmalonyl Co-A mutase-associated GTPase MeaB [Congregibacter sp.]
MRSPLVGLLLDAEKGDRRALARLISSVERGERLPPIPLVTADPSARLCVGVTGAPGAGKSTLVSALADELLKTADSAAVLAVDPSSPISRGALLGDRVRMHQHARSPNVFIRSMATRAHQGGLASATQAARRLLQHCGWPLVLIETVGVGQVELDVVNTADLVVVVLNPGWGDEIQANKAGLMEVADVFVINKADRPGLAATRRDIDAVIINRPEKQRPPVLETVASEGAGVAALAEVIWQVQKKLLESGEMLKRRERQLRTELSQRLRRRFSSELRQREDGNAFGAQVALLASGECDVETAVDALLLELLSELSNVR